MMESKSKTGAAALKVDNVSKCKTLPCSISVILLPLSCENCANALGSGSVDDMILLVQRG